MQQKRLSVSPLTGGHFKGQPYVALGSIPTTQNQEVDLLLLPLMERDSYWM